MAPACDRRGDTEAGASAVTVHGRTMNQRYCKAADWSTIAEVAR